MWNSRPSAESTAAALATPVAAGANGGTETPAAAEQSPQAAKHRPPPVRKTAPTRRLQPGDLICGACGEGNPSVRKFCSRCGQSLVEAEVVKRPWWKKLLPSRGPKTMKVAPGQQAGPGKQIDVKLRMRKIFRKVRLVAGIVIIIAGLAYGAIPSLRHHVDSLFNKDKNHILSVIKPNYVIVHATSVKWNKAIAGHPGTKAVDEFTNTYWLAKWNKNKEPMLTLYFGHKVTLKEMIIYSGVAADYTAYGRPATLHVVYSNGLSDTIAVTDTDKQQTLSFKNANGITSAEFQIAGVYPASKGSTVAITEMEVFALKL
jgi:hypothetical protein